MAAHTAERRAAALQRGRESQHHKLIKKVDPDGILAATDPAELARRVDALKREQYREMGRRGAAALKAKDAHAELVQAVAAAAATAAAEAVMRELAKVRAA